MLRAVRREAYSAHRREASKKEGRSCGAGSEAARRALAVLHRGPSERCGFAEAQNFTLRYERHRKGRTRSPLRGSPVQPRLGGIRVDALVLCPPALEAFLTAKAAFFLGDAHLHRYEQRRSISCPSHGGPTTAADPSGAKGFPWPERLGLFAMNEPQRPRHLDAFGAAQGRLLPAAHARQRRPRPHRCAARPCYLCWMLIGSGGCESASSRQRAGHESEKQAQQKRYSVTRRRTSLPVTVCDAREPDQSCNHVLSPA